MQERIRFKGGSKPGGTGFATPHIPGVPEHEPDGPVNDSLGSIHPADTIETNVHNEKKSPGKGSGDRTAE